MKTNTKSTTHAAKWILLILAAGGFALPCQGGLMVNFSESGANLAINVSGSLDLTGATPFGVLPSPGGQTGFDIADLNTNLIGQDDGFVSNTAPTLNVWLFAGATLQGGSASWSGGPVATTSDLTVAVSSNGEVLLPSTYTSGAALSGTGTVTGASFATFGMSAGESRVWQLGSGDTVTFAAIPEPSSFALGCILLALLGRRKRRRF